MKVLKERLKMEDQLQTPPITDQEKVNLALIKGIEELKKKVSAIETNTVIETLQLPPDVIEAAGLVPPPKLIKRGRGARPLLEIEIKQAYEKNDNCAAASAKSLGVSYKTFQKHAQRYGIWRTNQYGEGSKKKIWDANLGKYPLNQILEGKFPEYPIYRLKDRLIRSGIKKAECEMCHRDDRRITDGKMPLLLNFEDGNRKNHKLENIKVYCYTCTFLYGKGYIRRGKTEFHFNDPDRLQGAITKIEARF